jgi:hypothetical protein
MTHPLVTVSLIGAAIAGMGLAAHGDEFGLAPDHPDAEMHFTRLAYSGRSGSFGGYQDYWAVDYDDAEYHFREAVSRLTRVDIGNPRIYRLSSDALFNYPWLYAVEVGYWYLSDTEAARLREYLLRGGFLMVDDFHGLYQWAGFAESMQRVFPDRPIVEIPLDDEVLHVLYDLNQRTQIYGIRMLGTGITYEDASDPDPHWRGIYDDEGRLMVAINYNMDLGDAWEHADWPQYPEPLTALAYRFAVNYVIYAMTH